MKTIADFTPEIKAKIPEYIKKYTSGVDNGGRWKNFSQQDAEELIHWNYEKCNYKKPVVIVAGNPYEAQLIFNFIKANEKLYAPILNLIYCLKNNTNVMNATLGDTLDDKLRAKLRNTLHATLRDTLRAKLDDTLYNKLDDTLRATLRTTLNDKLDDTLGDTLGDTLFNTLLNTLHNTLFNTLDATLLNTLFSTLDDKLDDKLRAKLRDTLHATLRNTLDAALGNTLDDTLDTKLHATLDDTLFNTLRNTLDAKLDDKLGNTLDDTLGDTLDDKLRNTLDDKLFNALRDTLRNTLDNALRAKLGDTLFSTLDDTLGNTLRAKLCNTLDDKLRNTLYDTLFNTLLNTLHNTLFNTLDDKLCNTLGAKLDNKLRNTLDDTLFNTLDATLDDTLRDTLLNALRDTLRNTLRDTLRDKLDATLDDKLFTYNYSYLWTTNVYSNALLAWYKFAFDEFNIDSPIKVDLNYWNDLYLKSGVYSAIFSELVCVVSKYPKRVYRDSEERLHNVNGIAVEWESISPETNFVNYFIHGRNIPKHIAEIALNNELTKEIFVKEQNDEYRSAWYNYLGEEKTLQMLEANPVNTFNVTHSNSEHETITLFKTKENLNILKNKPYAWLKRVCPSTGNVYLTPTNADFKTAEESAKFHRPDWVPTSLGYYWYSRS